MIPENRVESIQGHLRAIEMVLVWNLVFMQLSGDSRWLTYAGLIPWNSMGLDHYGDANKMIGETAPAFAKEFSNTHARVKTTTTSSVAPTN